MRALSVYFLHQPRLWWWSIWVVIMAILAGLIQYDRKVTSQLDILDADHINIISSANSTFNRELGDIRNTARLLSIHLQDLLESQNESTIDSFSRVGASLPNVSQLRWLNMEGQEVYRVNFAGMGSQAVSGQNLQNKAHRGYFKAILNTLPGELILSDIDLNIENGKVVTPLEPTIRALLHSTPNHPLGEGFLIVNFRLTSLFHFLSGLSDTKTQLLVAENKDQWLIHPDDTKQWTSNLKTGKHNLPNDIPRLWQHLNTAPAGSLIEGDQDNIYSAVKSSLQLSERADQQTTIYFIARTPNTLYRSIQQQALTPAILVTMVVFFVGLLLIYREAALGLRVQQLTQLLETEKTGLANALQRQQVLQDELVEVEKMASLGMLVAGVSHELNTPIGATVMTVSGLQRKVNELDKRIAEGLTRSALEEHIRQSRDAADLAMTNLQRASSLIQRFKRLAVDRSEEIKMDFNLAQTVNDLLDAMKPQFKGSRLQIEVDIPASIFMDSYPGTLSQVLQNLINNAMNHAFNDNNGTIAIKAEQMQEQVFVTVTDNGHGIAQDVADTLFDPFVTTNRGQGNTGLGLHLVHRWVTHVLQGHIQVNSTPGQGTCFILELPVSPTDTDSEEHN